MNEMDKEIMDNDAPKSSKAINRIKFGFKFLVVLLLIFFLVRETARLSPWLPRHPTISNNLKQWGMIIEMSARENPNMQYPPLTQNNNLWVPDLNTLYPEYLTYLDIVINPNVSRKKMKTMLEELHREGQSDLEKAMTLMAQTYVYPGWAIQNSSDVQVIKWYRIEKGQRAGDITTKDAHLHWMQGTKDFKYFETPHSTTPILAARPGYYFPGSRNRTFKWAVISIKQIMGIPVPIVIPVVFQDGHVETFPLDDAPDHIKALAELFPEEITD